MGPIRLGTALSAFVAATALTGCAIGGHQQAQLDSTLTGSNIGTAARAWAALQAGDTAAAVSLAENSAEAAPNNAAFRLLLGNCYFAAGRFESAEEAYRDSLSLLPGQPKVMLKLALAQIAQGKDDSALGYLEMAREGLDPADYGLGIALAGHPADAVAVLQQAARAPGADARVRQNLALAYGLSGDWAEARIVAAQDVAPGQLDQRIHQWMQMATPARASDQVAALTGVTPAQDSGQPERLALKDSGNPAQAYAQAEAPSPAQAAAVQPPQPVEPAMAQEQLAQPSEVAAAQPMPAQAAPAPHWLPETADELAASAPGADASQADATAVPAQAVAKAVEALASVPLPRAAALPTKFAKADAPTFVEISDQVKKAAARARSTEKSNAVVQIGAYSSPERVADAWNQLSRRYPSLAAYRPVSARFVSAKGLVYRLSVKGFESAGDAKDLCMSLRGKGKPCFVRQIAGDAPVEIASR